MFNLDDMALARSYEMSGFGAPANDVVGGAATGATTGAVAGPWGAVIGGAVGAASGLLRNIGGGGKVSAAAAGAAAAQRELAAQASAKAAEAKAAANKRYAVFSIGGLFVIALILAITRKHGSGKGKK